MLYLVMMSSTSLLLTRTPTLTTTSSRITSSNSIAAHRNLLRRLPAKLTGSPNLKMKRLKPQPYVKFYASYVRCISCVLLQTSTATDTPQFDKSATQSVDRFAMPPTQSDEKEKTEGAADTADSTTWTAEKSAQQVNHNLWRVLYQSMLHT